MSTTRTLDRLVLAAMVALGFACGDDDPTGPPPVTFPDWPADISAALCVRGTGVLGDTKSSSITNADCDVNGGPLGDEGYYEMWRVRVASAADVTFDASSTFDNYLAVMRVTAVAAHSIELLVMERNDDRSPTNLNALITVRLEPNVDYAVTLSSTDYADTGPYTLAIR